MKKKILFSIILLLVVLSFYLLAEEDATPPEITVNDINNIAYSVPFISNQFNNVINISINEPGKCKISLSNQGYDEMTVFCEDKENNIKLCSQTFTQSGAYTLYIACNDSLGNFHSSETNKKLSITVQVAKAPVIKGVMSFSGDENPPFVTSSTSHTINLYVKPASICRLSKNNESYDDMADDISCEPDFASQYPYCVYSEKEIKNKEFDEAHPNGDYAVFIACKDKNGNKNTRANNFLINYTIYVPVPDTTPPTISNINHSQVTNQSAEIRWETNEKSNSKVYYGLNKTNLNKTKTIDDNVTSHLILLTNLMPNEIYFYNVSSCDSSDNCEIKGIFNFTTLETPKDKEAPVILDRVFKIKTNVSAIITWKTGELSRCIFYYGKNKLNLTHKIEYENFSLEYKINLTGIDVETVYFYRIFYQDLLNNSNMTEIYNFTLKPECIPDFECGEWSECIEGIQTRLCYDKNNCTKPREEERECVIEVKKEVECETNEDCEEGEVCVEGKCELPKEPECETNEDCEEIEICVEGKCIKKEIPKKKFPTAIIVFTISVIILIGGLGGAYYLYLQDMIPQLDPVFSKLDPILDKLGLSKLKKPRILKIPEIDPLKSYIDQMLRAGYSQDQIYHHLLKHGYRPDQINKYFKI